VIFLIKAEVFELLQKKNSVVSSMEMPRVGKISIVFENELQQKELKHIFSFIAIDIFFDGKDRYGNIIDGGLIQD